MFEEASPWPESFADMLPACPSRCFGATEGSSRCFDEDEVGGPPSVIMDEDSGFRGLLDEPAATEDGLEYQGAAGVDGGNGEGEGCDGWSTIKL